MLTHWVVTFVGNLAGSLFVVAVIFGCKSYELNSSSISLISYLQMVIYFQWTPLDLP